MLLAGIPFGKGNYSSRWRLWPTYMGQSLLTAGDDRMKEIYIILFSVLLGAVGQIAFKYGATHIPETGSITEKIIAAWPIIGGLFLYGLSTLFWIYALRTVELSYAYPLISLGYVLVFAASYFLFQESISPLRLGGLVLIISGIVLVAKS